MIRFSGLATGMDTEQMVKDLMRVQRLPVDKLVQRRQTVEWQMDSYREVNRRFNEFRNKMTDNLILTRANLLAKQVMSSNDSRVSATATAAAGNVAYRINEVKQLATAASTFSNQSISGNTKIDPTKALINQDFANEIDWKQGVFARNSWTAEAGQSSFELSSDVELINADDWVVKVDGKIYEVVTSGTVDDLKDNQVLITENGSSAELQFTSSVRTGAEVNVSYVTESEGETPQYYTTASISTYDKNGNETMDTFIIQSSDTLNQVLSKINSSSVGVSAFYDEFTDKVTMTRKELGILNELGDEIQFSGDFFASTLGLNSYQLELDENNVVTGLRQADGTTSLTIDGSAPSGVLKFENGILTEDGIPIASKNIEAGGQVIGSTDAEGKFTLNRLQGGQNAKFTINGLETERNSNVFTIDGVTFTLKETFAASEGDVTLDVTTNTDTAFETIKQFVDDYNELLDYVNGLLKEERYRDYKPLTDEQKEAMSEREIELWEEKARSGLLRNDSIISGVMNQLRLDIYGTVSSELETPFKQLAAIGITTSKDYLERGKLELNEEKLRAAIEADAEGVHALFTADGATNGEQGIARRMRNTLDSAMTRIAERAGGSRGYIQNHQFTLGRNINDINDQISNFERRLTMIEDRYWRQFTAMETAINRANQQAEMLYAQLFGNQQ